MIFSQASLRPLASLTSVRLGGLPRSERVARSITELVELVRELDEEGTPLLLVSGGSNLLVSDEGFDGVSVVVRGGSLRRSPSPVDKMVLVEVEAGVPLDELVERSVNSNLSGLEFLSGIPGSVGAAPVRNVGAYGSEVSDVIVEVEAYDRLTGAVRVFSHAECLFSYRSSRFQASLQDGPGGQERFVVLRVCFGLTPTVWSLPLTYFSLAEHVGVTLGERLLLQRARKAVLRLRSIRGMVLMEGDKDTWSCGSFFTNPLVSQLQARSLPDGIVGVEHEGHVKLSAAGLMLHAGFVPGLGLPGPVALSSKHVLALTHRGGGTSRELAELARRIQRGVFASSGVLLTPEPRLVGVELES